MIKLTQALYAAAEGNGVICCWLAFRNTLATVVGTVRCQSKTEQSPAEEMIIFSRYAAVTPINQRIDKWSNEHTRVTIKKKKNRKQSGGRTSGIHTHQISIRNDSPMQAYVRKNWWDLSMVFLRFIFWFLFCFSSNFQNRITWKLICERVSWCTRQTGTKIKALD